MNGDEARVKAARDGVKVRWKAAEQPLCLIEDGKGNRIGAAPNDFPRRTYGEIESAAWADAARHLSPGNGGTA
jgi:hypothetical protein